ncbi:MAG TPA: GNAT family N-acetyltransferase [Dongiaceae bacterium]|jgi:GNAT superfamily N-acetyltransferase
MPASSAFSLRQLDRTEMAAAARIHRAAFDLALPWLAGLHTPEQDRDFFRARVFETCAVWGGFGETALEGVIAFREGWIDQLYIAPTAQGLGLGSALLGIAKSRESDLQLWTFQRNTRARAFYEARGFHLIHETDGAENEEREPDALYRWMR